LSCAKIYLAGKLKEWSENSGITCDEEWSDVFPYFKKEIISLKYINYLVKSSFAVLGLNAAIECPVVR
jgi:hypothetical protein